MTSTTPTAAKSQKCARYRYSLAELENMKYVDLKTVAREIGLRSNIKQKRLVKSIAQYYEENEIDGNGTGFAAISSELQLCDMEVENLPKNRNGSRSSNEAGSFTTSPPVHCDIMHAESRSTQSKRTLSSKGKRARGDILTDSGVSSFKKQRILVEELGGSKSVRRQSTKAVADSCSAQSFPQRVSFMASALDDSDVAADVHVDDVVFMEHAESEAHEQQKPQDDSYLMLPATQGRQRQDSASSSATYTINVEEKTTNKTEESESSNSNLLPPEVALDPEEEQRIRAAIQSEVEKNLASQPRHSVLSSGGTPGGAKSKWKGKAIKTPDFKSFHRRKQDELESIDEYAMRTRKRQLNLLAGLDPEGCRAIQEAAGVRHSMMARRTPILKEHRPRIGSASTKNVAGASHKQAATSSSFCPTIFSPSKANFNFAAAAQVDQKAAAGHSATPAAVYAFTASLQAQPTKSAQIHVDPTLNTAQQPLLRDDPHVPPAQSRARTRQGVRLAAQSAASVKRGPMKATAPVPMKAVAPKALNVSTTSTRAAMNTSKSNNGSCNTGSARKNPTPPLNVGRTKFDLNASLKRRLPYKPHTGPLRPFVDTTQMSSARSAVYNPRVQKTTDQRVNNRHAMGTARAAARADHFMQRRRLQ